jgi:DNA primase
LTRFYGWDIISFAAWDRRLKEAGRQTDLSVRRQVAREMEFALMPTRELTVATGSFDAKERVKQAVDIVDLVGSHIQLRRQGRNYVGLCPWHDDSRPSLQVNPERQSFKCWVCDIGGDVFSFVMKIEGVEFREALQMLADRAGIVIEKPQRRRFASSGEAASRFGGEYGEYADGEAEAAHAVPTNAENKRTLLQAIAWAASQYHTCLLEAPEADAARRYLDERGITAESIERFQLGFSPLERDWILRSVREKGEAEVVQRRAKILETIGILIRPTEGGSPFDRFRGRLLFSIRDAQGRPVGIGGRVLPELDTKSPAKYVNSPETPLFTKSKLLYGLDLARETLRKTRTALVMEGYTDVIVAHQYGFTNAVAVLGTALGESHIRLLKAHADRIVLVLDGDEAGTRRANEVLELFIAQQADLQILTLPEDLDPCDYLHKYGAEAFRELLATKAVDALDHAFEVTTRGIDVERDIHGAGQAIERLLGIVAKAPRLGGETRGDARIQEQKIVQRLAGKFRVDEQDLRRRLAALRRRAAARASAPRPADAVTEQSDAQPVSPPDTWELAVLQLIVAHPESFAAICGKIGVEPITNPACRRVFETCCRLSNEGVEPSFDRLMLEFDEPAIQSLLVGIDEAAQATGQPAADPEVLLNGLVETFQRKEIERQRPGQIGTLREGGLDDAGQAALLDEILRQKRSLPK